MNNELFHELLESIEEAGAIMRGEKPASKTTVIAADTLQDQHDMACKVVFTNGADMFI